MSLWLLGKQAPGMTRIALIHALAHSVGPINDEMARVWPDCQRMNLLDDSLSADLARNAKAWMRPCTSASRRLRPMQKARARKPFCSHVQLSVPASRPWRRVDPGMPVLKPNEAMVADAAGVGRRVGLIASFAPTLVSMPSEFPVGIEVIPDMAEGAMDALDSGDVERHDGLVAESALRLIRQGCDVIALAQFSMARAQDAVRQVVQVPVLTTPGSAVAALRRRLNT